MNRSGDPAKGGISQSSTSFATTLYCFQGWSGLRPDTCQKQLLTERSGGVDVNPPGGFTVHSNPWLGLLFLDRIAFARRGQCDKNSHGYADQQGEPN
jgi:hypothetical protein